MGCAPSSPRGSRSRRSERDLRRFRAVRLYNKSVVFASRINREANVSTLLCLLHVIRAPRVSSSHAYSPPRLRHW